MLFSAESVEPKKTQAHVELPTDSETWQDVDEIRAEICLPPSAEGTIGCELTLGTQSEGFDYPDAYWFAALVSLRGGNFWNGWREFRMPSECFYTRGMPAGWGEFSSAEITLPAGADIRNIRLVSP